MVGQHGLGAGRSAMHPRVTTLIGSTDQADIGTADFRETVLPLVNERGGRGGILLLDRESGRAVAITLWNDEEQMRRSEEEAVEHRRRVSSELDSEAPIVERYEVAVLDL